MTTILLQPVLRFSFSSVQFIYSHQEKTVYIDRRSHNQIANHCNIVSTLQINKYKIDTLHTHKQYDMTVNEANNKENQKSAKQPTYHLVQ